MANTINFVQNRRKKLTKSQKNDFRIFQIVAGGFGVLILVFIVTMGLNFYLQFRVSGIQDQQKQMERRITDQQDVEKSIIITIEKIKVLAELFEQRYDKQSAIKYFSEIFGPQVLIKDIDYEADNQILSLRVESNSVFSLENIFEELSNPEVEEKFGKVAKSDLARNESGKYNMAITLTLGEEQAKKKSK